MINKRFPKEKSYVREISSSFADTLKEHVLKQNNKNSGKCLVPMYFPTL